MIRMTIRNIAGLIVPALLVILLTGIESSVFAGPPTPEEYLDSDDLEELDEEAYVFSENYLDLIHELEDVLGEFELFFEEFGQVSLTEMAEEIKDFRSSLYEDYSEEAYEDLIDEMDSVLDDLDDIKSEMEDTDTRSQRKYLRRLRAFQRDLEDIREDLEDQFNDERFQELLDSESLKKIIEQALEQSHMARREYEMALHEAEHHRLAEEVPEPAETPEIDISLPKTIIISPDVPDPAIAAPGFDFSEWQRERSAYMNVELDAYITQNRSIPVEGDKVTIEIRNDIGSIDVKTWNRSQVDAVLTVSYNESSKKSREMAESIKLNAKGDDRKIMVEIDYPTDREKTAGIVASQLEISLPRTNPVLVKNSFGPVKIGDLRNMLNIESNFASIDVIRLEGDASISNSTGPIYLEDLSGNITVQNSFGPIEAVGLDGSIEISNNYSGISVKKSTGPININNSGGVSLEQHRGDANIAVSNGFVEVYGLEGSLNLSNSFGKVHIENVSGEVNAQNSNDLLEIHDVVGSLLASNSFSPIYIDGVDGDMIVNSSNSDVSVENTKGSVIINNSFGKIAIEKIDGPLTVENSNAPVVVTKVQKDVDVSNQFGPVYLTSVIGSISVKNKNSVVDLIDIGGASRVKNSFGTVTGDNLKGPIYIHNENGSVELARLYMKREDSCQVSTSFGDINMVLLKPLNYNITAQTTGGNVKSDLPMVYNTTGHISVADYSGAVVGPTITINGQNASIYISAQD